MAEPISWEWAERIAVVVAGKEPLAASYHADGMASELAAATAEAEQLVSAETGLVPLEGPARATVTDREGWIRANISSFRRLLAPLGEKLAPKLSLPGMGGAARALTGMELGTLLGWMSTRVLGQYDLLITEEDQPEQQDMVYFVGPNILSLERRYGFPPAEFRLWIALHEVTHRAQFTGIPWMRQHFVSLVGSAVASLDPSPRVLLERLGHMANEVRQGRNPLQDGGLAGAMASPAQRDVLERIQGLMSLLEGHGDVTMDRAGADRVPSAARFSQVLRDRRNSAGAAARLFQQLIGLEAKLRQYQQGEEFIAAVEEHGGPDLLAVAWRGPQWLPSVAEIRDPARWIGRVQHDPPADESRPEVEVAPTSDTSGGSASAVG